ncbi:mannose-1-phosphate guanylyltransferase/mannose-6-phosphate isomerase [Poseidonibacter lekithochrous]|uniref:mannose-1-phosphate guanylyltransferase/mannose-6-phosphate isomerase n=1 Tax=Poseidonibacter lekithochrous TaxID=1904463 RepID=UPI0008FCC0D9|nr:mannose-1-phosphate guanylyltransferase/mannose-6-phosphate isomerase [Poseidonibacter lekithochrous]QKJ23605.1 bifunctional mannose-6-phosphate isomerase / mannose-1-phosphate guanylyltransferase [Poseidonibacter lekithochrous]
MVNVILCGGNGTRLWPISRTHMPKQFTQLISEYSLFQDTILRNSKLTNKFLIVCNEDHYFMALDQIDEIKNLLPSNFKVEFILESVGRNTAAAIIIASLHVQANETVFVTPCDHSILNIENYEASVLDAKQFAMDDYITLFGIVPTYAEVGYGYIKAKDEMVNSFHEKPDLETAHKFVDSKKYLWNSGMFCFKASVLLNSVREFALDIYEPAIYAYSSAKTKSVIRINKELMEDIPAVSIDVAVMEKCFNLKVVRSDIGWSDLGSFCSIYKALEKDENNNAVKYTTDEPLLLNSKDNLVISNHKKVALVEVENLAIVNTPDALLIVNKEKTQDVKEVVSQLVKEGSTLAIDHPLVHRPWGTYNVMEEKANYKFKTILVKPKKRLSLQKHFHRNEHWIVLSGTATVTIGKNKKLVRANESVYIPMGKKHRLENEGKIDLVLIEVQVGEYLEEDDIVRYEDDYKRK